jgi:hypothetical protein
LWPDIRRCLEHVARPEWGHPKRGRSRENRSLLIYAPVPLYEKDGVLYQEDQACNGLRLWTDNFSHLIVLMPLEKGDPPDNWIPLAQVGPALGRIEIVRLPVAYRPDQFLLRLPSARRKIGPR